MGITAPQRPDSPIIANFRRRHRRAFECLFVQVLRLVQKAGPVKLGHVALDDTKIRAGASKTEVMSYERMQKSEDELAREVTEMPDQAAAAHAQKDGAFGTVKSGDNRPDCVANKQKRLEETCEA